MLYGHEMSLTAGIIYALIAKSTEAPPGAAITCWGSSWQPTLEEMRWVRT